MLYNILFCILIALITFVIVYEAIDIVIGVNHDKEVRQIRRTIIVKGVEHPNANEVME